MSPWRDTCRRKSSMRWPCGRGAWASPRSSPGRSCAPVITPMRWCRQRRAGDVNHLLAKSTSMLPSLFLSLDGLDGAGKSTQCRLLADWLRGRGKSVVACHDPGGTDLGQQLREILLTYRGSMSLTCEAFLFMASRAQLVAEVIRPALEAGKIVVADRFLLANVV